jgi:hypothetical protein
MLKLNLSEVQALEVDAEKLIDDVIAQELEPIPSFLRPFVKDMANKALEAGFAALNAQIAAVSAPPPAAAAGGAS